MLSSLFITISLNSKLNVAQPTIFANDNHIIAWANICRTWSVTEHNVLHPLNRPSRPQLIYERVKDQSNKHRFWWCLSDLLNWLRKKMEKNWSSIDWVFTMSWIGWLRMMIIEHCILGLVVCLFVSNYPDYFIILFVFLEFTIFSFQRDVETELTEQKKLSLNSKVNNAGHDRMEENKFNQLWFIGV